MRHSGTPARSSHTLLASTHVRAPRVGGPSASDQSTHVFHHVCCASAAYGLFSWGGRCDKSRWRPHTCVAQAHWAGPLVARPGALRRPAVVLASLPLRQHRALGGWLSGCCGARPGRAVCVLSRRSAGCGGAPPWAASRLPPVCAPKVQQARDGTVAEAAAAGPGWAGMSRPGWTARTSSCFCVAWPPQLGYGMHRRSRGPARWVGPGWGA